MPRRDGPGRETLVRLHHLMRLTRSVEERLASLYRQGKIAGSLFRSLGQEAASVAPAVALEDGDLIAPLFRDLGALLARGFTPRECFAQYLGRAAGPTGGREAAHHMGDVAGRGVVAAISSLGETVCVMAGCALGLKLRGSDRVCLTWIGDGGTSTGAFHEGMNFAAVRRLPLIVVIENNGFAYSTPGARQTRQGDFTVRGTAYGCAGVGVDGNDAAQLHDAVRAAAARARAGGGPTVIEARTFRLVGHAEHDDASYLPPELVKDWTDKDPIRRIEERLVAGGFATPAGLEQTAARIGKSLDEDLAWAEACPPPAPESALGGLYDGDAAAAGVPEPLAGLATSKAAKGSMGVEGAGASKAVEAAKASKVAERSGEPDGGPSWGVM